MSWTDVFPVLDNDHLDAFDLKASPEERAELDEWFAIDKVVNPSRAKHLVVFSLFWKNVRSTDPDLPEFDRETLQNASKLGLVKRYDPWEHYVEPLLHGATMLRIHRPDVGCRIYLAADMAFLIEDFTALGCEVCLMRSSSLRHSPGAMWRYLALEEKRRLITISDADRAAFVETDVQRTEVMAKMGMSFWRVPVLIEENLEGFMSYRPIVGCQMGSSKSLPAGRLMKATIWHTRNGTISTKCKTPWGEEKQISGTDWPGYCFDEWSLHVAFYPRILRNGVLTFLPANQSNRLLSLDIEYCMWANPRSEIRFYGKSGDCSPGGGCCGPTQGASVEPPQRQEMQAAFQRMQRLIAQLSQEGGGRNEAGAFRPTDTGLLAFCTVCHNRLTHLKKTLPVTMKELKNARVAKAVVFDYSCSQGTAPWVLKEFASEIASGALVLARLKGKRKFQSGVAKAAVHALASHYADSLMTLDVDNFISEKEIPLLLRVAQNHRVFVGHQYDPAAPATYGRIYLPSSLYRSVGGYHCKLPHDEGEDATLLEAVLAQPDAAYVPIAMTARWPLPYSEEDRLKAQPNHKKARTGDPVRLAAKKTAAQRSAPLATIQIEIWDDTGNHHCALDHFFLTLIPAPKKRATKKQVW